MELQWWSEDWPHGQFSKRLVNAELTAARPAYPSCTSAYVAEFRGAPAVPVTFHPHFSSARRMKLRSNVLVASSNRLSVELPPRLELREVEFERQVFFGNEFLVADGDQALDQVFELADVAGPPVASSAAATVGSVIPWMRFRKRALYRRRKNSASCGMSSLRSRSGGSLIGMTLMR